MRICDISREDVVVGTVTITVEIPAGNEGGLDVVSETKTYEVGGRAANAFLDTDWKELNDITPAALRKKDPVRSEAARKAAVTRAENKEKAKDGDGPEEKDPKGDKSKEELARETAGSNG